MTHQAMDSAMRECIDTCQACHDTCLEMAMSHCLAIGGAHVEAEHMRLMMNCAEICQTAANFMLSQSPLHTAVCAVCAEVCNACAISCEKVGNMDQCVEECRRCAQSCQEMGRMPRGSQQPASARGHARH